MHRLPRLLPCFAATAALLSFPLYLRRRLSYHSDQSIWSFLIRLDCRKYVNGMHRNIITLSQNFRESQVVNVDA